MKSLGKCIYCTETVSEIGAYVKISSSRHAHVHCHVDPLVAVAREEGRKAVLDEIAQKQADKLAFEETRAKLAYGTARRCEKCGVAMLADRPDALPGAYTVRAPSSSDQRQCSECVRAEIGARAGARRTAAPASAAEAIRTAPTRPADAAQEKKPEGPVPDRFSLLDLDD